ncbi:MAG: hypothetical protein P4L49_12740, partial [Desulfosporosinus sp.]|nr:hypothetical protein [Desulfosporosinus sp.]
SRTEVRFGAVSAKSLIILVEMMSDSLFGNRVEIRTTCLRAVWSLTVLAITKTVPRKRLGYG